MFAPTFPAVVGIAYDDEAVPLQGRIETVDDYWDLELVHDTERHLLYAARTRARDHPLMTSVKHASKFLDDLWP